MAMKTSYKQQQQQQQISIVTRRDSCTHVRMRDQLQATTTTTTTTNLHCHKECNIEIAPRTYVCWRLRMARGKKSLRSAKWHLCSLSLASLLLQSLALSIVSTVHACSIVVQLTIFTNISVTILYNDLYQPFKIDIIIYNIHTLAQIRLPMLHDYSPHAKALGNNAQG